MSWTNIAVNSPEDAIQRSVKWRQSFGLKQEHAFDDAGKFYGLKPRYVRGVVRSELRIGDRWRLLKHRWWADMDRQAAELRAMADDIQRQKEAEQLASVQLVLPLGDSAKCSDLSARSSSSGAGGAR